MRSRLALVLALVAAGWDSATRGAEGRPERVFDVCAFGARGDGVTDDSRAFQAALDAARTAGGGIVHVPTGTYVVAPPADAPGGPRRHSLTIGSNTWLRGDGPASVIRVKSRVGSYRALFSNHPDASSPVENVTISDVRFDQNCAASGGIVQPGHDDAFLAAIYLAWGGRHLTVARVRFDAVCGVNTVVMNAPGAEDLVVRDSFFRFVKGPTSDRTGFYDNTAVYLHGSGELVTGNSFESTPADGARGAIELHGARGVASGNLTRFYRSCVRVVGTNVAGEVAPRWNGFTVTGNTCADAQDAINVWSITSHHVRGVTISGNTISLAELDHLAAAPHLRYFSGIAFAWDAVSGQLAGDIADVVVEGNVITAQQSQDVWGESAYATGGILLTAEGSLHAVLVRGNVVRDVPTKGIHVQAMGRGARATGVRVEGNAIVDAGHDRAAGYQRAGIVVAGRLEDVEVAHNSILDTSVPFRGRFAIRVAAAPGSMRVGVHDNLWSTADPRAGYDVALEGAVDAGRSGRTERIALSPRGGEVVTFDPARAQLWDVSVSSGGAVFKAAPTATPGQRLTIRVRNMQAGQLGPVRWEGFKLAPWTSPGPGHYRVLEVMWDGSSWNELYRSVADVPN